MYDISTSELHTYFIAVSRFPPATQWSGLLFRNFPEGFAFLCSFSSQKKMLEKNGEQGFRAKKRFQPSSSSTLGLGLWLCLFSYRAYSLPGRLGCPQMPTRRTWQSKLSALLWLLAFPKWLKNLFGFLPSSTSFNFFLFGLRIKRKLLRNRQWEKAHFSWSKQFIIILKLSQQNFQL